LRNFRRAGVAKKKSPTSTCVPTGPEAGSTARTRPPSTRIRLACAAVRGREVIASRAAAPIEGSASPRKPSVVMRTRSSSASFEVAWRCTASASSSAAIPAPSSAIAIAAIPPSSSETAIRRAPASSAFSISSFTAAAGRSITSPAAMRLAIGSGSTRIRASRSSSSSSSLQPGRLGQPGARRPPAREDQHFFSAACGILSSNPRAGRPRRAPP
jgi:hypothetical protein